MFFVVYLETSTYLPLGKRGVAGAGQEGENVKLLVVLFLVLLSDSNWLQGTYI